MVSGKGSRGKNLARNKALHRPAIEDRKDGVIGIANYVAHEHTLGLTPRSDFVRYTVYQET